MNPPRILLISGEYPPLPGGVGDYTANLRRALADSGISTSVLSSRGASGDGVRTTRGWGWRTIQKVGRVLRDEPADIVHIQYQAGAFDMHLAINLLPIAIQSRLGLPVVTTFHDLRPPYLFPKAGPARKLALLRMARTSSAVITTNPGDEQILSRSRIPSWRIPIGPNLPPVTERGIAIAPDTVAFFGFPTRSKGIEDLIAALGNLPGRSRVTLLLVGDQGQPSEHNDIVPPEEIDARARTAGVALRRTGRLSPQEASDTLASAGAIALPFRGGASQRSGSLLAALQSGRPVIATAPANASNLGALRTLPQLTLALREDIEDLCNAIASALQAPRDARPLPDEYRWSSIASRHVEVYDALLKQHTMATRG